MRQDLQKNSTEYLIESIHQAKKKRSIILNRTYLDDENLPDYERTEVLNQVFNQNIREKQIRRIILRGA